jgi:hypothetical protein
VVPRRILMDGDPEPPAGEPEALCDECGALGTVGRATRHTTPPAIRRFCRVCWPDARTRLQANWGRAMEEHLTRLVRGEPIPEDAPPGFGFHSAVWSDALEFLKQIEDAAASPDRKLNTADLRTIVEQIQALVPEMDGPMPPEVVAFIQRYGPPAG